MEICGQEVYILIDAHSEGTIRNVIKLHDDGNSYYNNQNDGAINDHVGIMIHVKTSVFQFSRFLCTVVQTCYKRN
jgi:hypothetical protein